ncbi:MAG: hypothetical protein NZM31_11900 [Gemmatales bacterium]|nr:hypothetical protein [Gemmatales bacterium]MDW8387698.1 hypothetical protein [Gemmatales bacterium]
MAALGWYVIPLLAGLGFVAVFLAWKPLRNWFREVQAERARELFTLQRERLEAKFLEAANASGKPRGLRWADCDWASEVRYVRDRRSGEIFALVEVAVRFEAIPDGPMEDWPAVRDIRQATGVFFFHKGQWHTHGRALFNMTPDQAVNHFGGQYESLSA